LNSRHEKNITEQGHSKSLNLATVDSAASSGHIINREENITAARKPSSTTLSPSLPPSTNISSWPEAQNIAMNSHFSDVAVTNTLLKKESPKKPTTPTRDETRVLIDDSKPLPVLSMSIDAVEAFEPDRVGNNIDVSSIPSEDDDIHASKPTIDVAHHRPIQLPPELPKQQPEKKKIFFDYSDLNSQDEKEQKDENAQPHQFPLKGGLSPPHNTDFLPEVDVYDTRHLTSQNEVSASSSNGRGTWKTAQSICSSPSNAQSPPLSSGSSSGSKSIVMPRSRSDSSMDEKSNEVAVVAAVKKSSVFSYDSSSSEDKPVSVARQSIANSLNSLSSSQNQMQINGEMKNVDSDESSSVLEVHQKSQLSNVKGPIDNSSVSTVENRNNSGSKEQGTNVTKSTPKIRTITVESSSPVNKKNKHIEEVHSASDDEIKSKTKTNSKRKSQLKEAKQQEKKALKDKKKELDYSSSEEESNESIVVSDSSVSRIKQKSQRKKEKSASKNSLREQETGAFLFSKS